MSRNHQYESRRRAQGLDKFTLWLPVDRADDFKLAASLACSDSDLTVSVLRRISSGRVVSIHNYKAPVTGDAHRGC